MNLEISFFDAAAVTNFLLFMVLNLTFAVIVMRGLYYRTESDSEFLFPLLTTNLLVFCVTSTLGTLNLQATMALGMFAVFSLLRYRTELLPIREMTFLFAGIIIAVINSLGFHASNMVQLLMENALIVASIYLLDRNQRLGKTSSLRITYERIELLPPSRRDELIADLNVRTGMNVKDFRVESVNLLQDTASLLIYCDQRCSTSTSCK
jgi:hypothetical protein